MGRRISGKSGTVSRLTLPFAAAVMIASAGLVLTHSSGRAAAACTACGPIRHIVIMIKENHSFDNIFGRFPGANGATTARAHGKKIQMADTPDPLARDIAHDARQALKDVDKDRMNGFDTGKGAIQNKVDVADSQYSPSQVADYWAYAQHYALADDFFSYVLGDSFPNHLAAVAGQNLSVISNPMQKGRFIGSPWGCDSTKGTYVQTWTRRGAGKRFPCFTAKTLADEANAAHVSWKYYAAPKTDPGYIWSALDAFKQIRRSSQWDTNVATPKQFDVDVQSGNLPALSWITPPLAYSDHPPESICAGQNWTVSKLDELMQSPLWSSTVVILVWDDFGGFYDHVKPPKGSSPFAPGLRVPMLVISPFAKRGVFHGQLSFNSIDRFVENTLHLPHLMSYSRTGASVSSMLDTNRTPLAPLRLTQAPNCPSAPGGGIY